MHPFISRPLRSFLVFVYLGMTACFAAASVDYTAYEELLQKYVTDSGVRYADWFADTDDLKQLETFLGSLAAVDVTDLSREEQTAFYINLYNAGMLQAVFEHYPIESVTEIGLIKFSIFKKRFIQLGQKQLSLDEIEKGILLKDYFDPRIHFAVNCASESCPPLRKEPFTGEQLETQLEEQTRAFAVSKRAVRIDATESRVLYSSLFKWYADDFLGENPAEFLNKYRKNPIKLSTSYDWLPYNWDLNVAR